MTLMSVVLPAPFGPIKPTASPSWTSMLKSLRATTPPNRLVTLAIERTGLRLDCASLNSPLPLPPLAAPEPETAAEGSSYRHRARMRDRKPRAKTRLILPLWNREQQIRRLGQEVMIGDDHLVHPRVPLLHPLAEGDRVPAEVVRRQKPPDDKWSSGRSSSRPR